MAHASPLSSNLDGQPADPVRHLLRHFDQLSTAEVQVLLQRILDDFFTTPASCFDLAKDIDLHANMMETMLKRAKEVHPELFLREHYNIQDRKSWLMWQHRHFGINRGFLDDDM